MRVAIHVKHLKGKFLEHLDVLFFVVGCGHVLRMDEDVFNARVKDIVFQVLVGPVKKTGKLCGKSIGVSFLKIVEQNFLGNLVVLNLSFATDIARCSGTPSIIDCTISVFNRLIDISLLHLNWLCRVSCLKDLKVLYFPIDPGLKVFLGQI